MACDILCYSNPLRGHSIIKILMQKEEGVSGISQPLFELQCSRSSCKIKVICLFVKFITSVLIYGGVIHYLANTFKAACQNKCILLQFQLCWTFAQAENE